MATTRVRLGVALASVILLVAMAGIAGSLYLGSILNAPFLESVVNNSLSPATNGIYRVSIGDLRTNLITRTLSARDVTLRVDWQVAESLSTSGAIPAILIETSLKNVEIEGVDIFRLVTDEDLLADGIEIDSPRIWAIIAPKASIDPDVDGRVPLPPTVPVGDPTPRATLDEIARGLPVVGITTVEVFDAEVDVVRLSRGESIIRNREDEPTDHLENLSIELVDLRLAPSNPFDASRLLFCEDVRVSLSEYKLIEEGLFTLKVEDLRLSTEEEIISVGEISYRPEYSSESFWKGDSPPGDRITLTVGPVRARGVGFREVIEQLIIEVDHLAASNLRVEVQSNKQRQAPAGSVPIVTPHGLIQDLPMPFSLDTLSLDGGSVTYSELGTKSVKPGTIRFGHLNAEITNITNDPDRMTRINPAVLLATGTINDSLSISARFDIPLLAPRPTMRVAARTGPFRIGILNTILPELEGIRLVGGEVDSVWTTIEFTDKRATGSVSGSYHGFAMQIENIESGDRNLGHKLTTFAANTFGIRKNNREDGKKPLHAGKVDYEVNSGYPFFQTLWEALRDGILDLVMK